MDIREIIIIIWTALQVDFLSCVRGLYAFKTGYHWRSRSGERQDVFRFIRWLGKSWIALPGSMANYRRVCRRTDESPCHFLRHRKLLPCRDVCGTISEYRETFVLVVTAELVINLRVWCLSWGDNQLAVCFILDYSVGNYSKLDSIGGGGWSFYRIQVLRLLLLTVYR